MRKVTLTLACAAALASVGCSIGMRLDPGAGIDRAAGDPWLRGQDDFFRRVNGTVRNHPAFDATFAVKPGDPMYLPPEERVSIW